MGGAFIHNTADRKLVQAEYESVLSHIFQSQATGDTLYASSGTQLSRLGIGSTNDVLTIASGVPAWTSSPRLASLGIGADAHARMGIYQTVTHTLQDSTEVAFFGIHGQTYGKLLSGTFIDHCIGVYGDAHVDAANTQNWTHAAGTPGLRGVYGKAQVHGDATGTIGGIAAFHGDLASGGTVTNSYGLFLESIANSGTLTNDYGIYIQARDQGSTGNWAIYTAAGNSTFQDGDLELLDTSTGVLGSILEFYQNSASPAVDDVVGRLAFYGEDNTSAKTEYGRIQCKLVNVTNTTEEAKYQWLLAVSAGMNLAMTLSAAGELWVDNDISFTTSVDSAAVADTVTIGGYEISAGHRALAISSEEVVVVEADETKFSHKIPIRINGATYNMMLCAT